MRYDDVHRVDESEEDARAEFYYEHASSVETSNSWNS
jgi:hypothetical protein